MLAKTSGRIERLARRVWFRNAPVVLVYHRICDTPVDPLGVCTAPRTFREHLEILGSRGEPMGLAELETSIDRGDVPKNAFAITLDDGYRDNFDIALPILEALRIPATFFITTNFILSPAPIWWDVLASATRHRQWNALRPVLFPNVDDVHRHLRSLPTRDRDEIIQRMLEALSLPESVSPPRLAPSQISQLARHPLVEIGAHSKTHPLLDQCTREEQRDEILGGRSILASLTGGPARTFAYPYGHSFSGMTTRIVSEAGFESAYVVDDRKSRKGNPLTRSRIVPRGEGNAFKAWLGKLVS